jgi:hypothetical protein
MAESTSSVFVAKSAILDGKYFTVIDCDDDGVKVKARCNSCLTKTVISGSTNALSNFTAHLKVCAFISKLCYNKKEIDEHIQI